MEPTAFTLGELLAWWGAAAAAVTALYLLRLRRRPVAVPWLHLWERVVAERATDRLWRRVRRWVSLLIALLVASLLVLALADLRFEAPAERGVHTVLLLDASGSMQAREPGGEQRIELLRRTAEAWIDGLGEDDRLLLVALEERPRPLGPWDGERAALRDALGGLGASDLPADACAGLAFARDALRGRPKGRVVLLGDGRWRAEGCEDLLASLTSAGLPVRALQVGSARPNVALGAVAARREPLDPARVGVMVELRNPAEQPRRVELRLEGDGQVVEVQPLTLEAGASLHRFYDGVAGVGELLRARIRPLDELGDALPEDDEAVAVLPARRRLRVLAVTDGNLYLQAALLLDEALEVTEKAPGEPLGDWSRYDVAVFDRWVPPEPPRLPAFYLRPEPAEGGWPGPVPSDGEVEDPWFERVDRRHPVLRWARLGDVNVARALRLQPRPGDRVLGGSRGAPLLLAGRREGVPFLVLAFDVRESDLPLRAAWPLLLLSSLQWLSGQQPGDATVPLQVGELRAIRVPAGWPQVRVVGPDGERATVAARDGLVRLRPRLAGRYVLEGPDGERLLLAASRAGSHEEDLSVPPAPTLGERKLPEASPPPPARGAPPWVWLTLAAVALLLAEWWSYQRRWTV